MKNKVLKDVITHYDLVNSKISPEKMFPLGSQIYTVHFKDSIGMRLEGKWYSTMFHSCIYILILLVDS